MTGTPSFPLVDRILGGNLEAELRRRRAEPAESFETIARWLSVTHGFPVSYSTVRRWCIELGIETAA